MPLAFDEVPLELCIFSTPNNASYSIVNLNVSFIIIGYGLFLSPFPLKWIGFDFLDMGGLLPTNNEILHTQPYPIIVNDKRLHLTHKCTFDVHI